jgi:hypothetical protein
MARPKKDRNPRHPKETPSSPRREKRRAAPHLPGTSDKPCTRCGGHGGGHEGWCPTIS